MAESTTTLARGAVKVRSARRGRLERRRARVALTFVAPIVVLFAVFKAYPFGYAFYLSLTKNKGGVTTFVGADNYSRLIHDPLFRKALSNTFQILLIQMPVQLVLALVIATALNSGLLWLRGVFRTAYFVPIVMGLVAYGVLFSSLLNPQYGAVNDLLGHIGIGPVPWLDDPFWAKVAIAIAMTWHYTGQTAVIYLAQMQSIPKELYEAASVDGAGAFRKFRAVTVPGLRPAIVLSVILSTIGALQLFDEPFVLTNGGPENATETIGLYLYRNGFQFFDFGYASAIGYGLTAIIVLISLIQLVVLERRER
ncbi:sugar ABC transporter permease [Actinoplanes sp. NPDC049596]|uniref:carbohydrate ABC transporter permease n=1 Tax=unclassified Actinoplanes TaxID=2626549 RepID=UPI003423C608